MLEGADPRIGDLRIALAHGIDPHLLEASLTGVLFGGGMIEPPGKADLLDIQGNTHQMDTAFLEYGANWSAVQLLGHLSYRFLMMRG